MGGEPWSWQTCMWLSCGCYALWCLSAAFIGEVKPAGSLFPVFLGGYLAAGIVGFFAVLRYRPNWSAQGHQYALSVLCGVCGGAGALLYFMALNRADTDADKSRINAVSSLAPAPAAILFLAMAALAGWSELKGGGERLLGTVMVLGGVYLLSRHS